jgi:peptidoglycan hydrolase-like protein with peptidoglycan-binding domain
MQAIVGAEPVDGDFGPKTEEQLRLGRQSMIFMLMVFGVLVPQEHAAESCDHDGNHLQLRELIQIQQQKRLQSILGILFPVVTNMLMKLNLFRLRLALSPMVILVLLPRELLKRGRSANGRKPDGIVGPKTWESMFGS